MEHVWLNVGCGDRKAPRPWINVDTWQELEPDQVWDCTQPWPYDDHTVHRIYMGQVIEHLDHPAGVEAALAEAARVLQAGGLLCVVTPDRFALAEKHCESWIRDNLTRGECRWPGDEHRWLPDRLEVHRLVDRVLPGALAVNVTNLHDGWPPGNRDPWDCCVISRKKI